MYTLLLLLCYGHGILNMCNDLSACCAHKGETGNDESEQVNSETQKNGPASCCILLSSACSTELDLWEMSC